MIRKSNLEPGKENWRSDLTYLSDWDVWLRHLMLGDCYIIPEKLSYFRIHANQTTSLLKQNYSIRFEQYNFYKSIYDEGRYDVNCFKQELQKVLKVKATDCVSIIYKILPRLGKRTNRTILKKAFAIGISEKVLFNPIFNFFFKKLELSQKKVKWLT